MISPGAQRPASTEPRDVPDRRSRSGSRPTLVRDLLVRVILSSPKQSSGVADRALSGYPGGTSVTTVLLGVESGSAEGPRKPKWECRSRVRARVSDGRVCVLRVAQGRGGGFQPPTAATSSPVMRDDEPPRTPSRTDFARSRPKTVDTEYGIESCVCARTAAA